MFYQNNVYNMSNCSKILMTIFENTKKVKALETILTASYEKDIDNVLYDIYGQYLAKVPKEKIEEDIRSKTLQWSSSAWKEHKFAQEELDEFISNPPNVEEGVMKCQKCGSSRTFSSSKQVRSADEGFTTFCRCAQCGANWRIN